jgi:hypothetical protein
VVGVSPGSCGGAGLPGGCGGALAGAVLPGRRGGMVRKWPRVRFCRVGAVGRLATPPTCTLFPNLSVGAKGLLCCFPYVDCMVI